jgi:multidrug transporter EmrE-like cation transporter
METSIVFIFGIAILITIIESFAQNTLKHAQLNNCIWRYILGLLFYVGVGMTLHYAYGSVPLGKMSIIWSCLSIISGITAGYLLYDEIINGYTIIAIFFAIMALVFAQLN